MRCPRKRVNSTLGLDFRYNAVFGEELAYYGAISGTLIQSDITADYICAYGTEEQKRRYLPAMISGELITAIAMTEPSGGSDLQSIKTTARSNGNDYVINGSKIYISNGQTADLILLAAKTDPSRGGKGISLIFVEADRAGFVRGRNLDKIGQHMADTSELFFNDVGVPKSNVLGQENSGFAYMMSQLPQERLSLAILAQGAAQRAFDETVNFTKDRMAFGRRVFDFQNSRFKLARLAAMGASGLGASPPCQGTAHGCGGGGAQILAQRNAVGTRR
jgi:alkylation response protein AidB-like acyl-CoA dehydrogenase